MHNAELPSNLADFSELLHRVLSGEEVMLSQACTPVARIVPVNSYPLPRIPGLDKDRVFISPDFNAPLPEDILTDFINPLDIENESIT
ncbi:MAG: type II toxin-antitoxin system Phd/YefM family antitoxin [Nostocaceae cyanobacterium]|nr:type II toxin-antitoxin system Phd/YefM family antitoxin [Nostocaceae cyanobacterium]